MTTQQTQLPHGLQHRATAGQVECTDCGRWAWDGENIRHSSRCDHPGLQVTQPAPITAPPAGATDWSSITPGSPEEQDAIEEMAVHDPALWNRAMNSDY